MTETAVQIAVRPKDAEAKVETRPAASGGSSIGGGLSASELRAWVWVILGVTALLSAASVAWLDRPVAIMAKSEPPVIRSVAQAVSSLGLSGYMLVGSAVVAAAAVLVRRRSERESVRDGMVLLTRRALFVLATVAVSGIGVQILKHLVGRARPKSLDALGLLHFDPFTIKASLASFPSGHTTSIVALAVALWFIMPKLRWTLSALAVAVAASRSLVGAHYVSDVLGGAALGAVTTIALTLWSAKRDVVFTRDGDRILLRGQGVVGPAIREAWQTRRTRA